MVNISNEQKKEPIRIGVIGCGWLGKALVADLITDNYYVVATTQQQEKLKEITSLGAQGEIISLPFGDFNVNSAAIFYCTTLVICIPPQLRKGKTDYPKKIADIVLQAEQSLVNKIVLISTTAVYGGLIGDISESATLKLDDEKVNLISQAEKIVLGFTGQSIVIRSAGLVGPNRHPGIFFRHSKLLTAPNSYVNLVHQKDVVALIIASIKDPYINGIFNAVSEMQVTKKHYYSIAANAMKLPKPVFDKHSEVELGKQIKGDKLRDYLSFQYQYDDLVSWLLKAT